MKLLVRFFLLLCFLLIGGSTYLDARPHQHLDSIRYASITKLEDANQVSLETFKNTTLLSFSVAPSLPEKQTGKMDLSSEDEDDNYSSKKHMARSHECGPQLQARPPTYFVNNIVTSLPCSKHFSYSSSDRYILFRVFRI